MLEKFELSAIETELAALTQNERRLPTEQLVDLIMYRITKNYGLCLSLEGKEKLVERITE